MKNIITLLFVVCFFSCKNDKSDNTSSTTNKNVVSVTADTIRISIDETFLPGYNITAYNKSLNYFYGYNHLLHQIDYFDLNENKLSAKKIKLEREGPNGLSVPKDIYVLDNEDIFLISEIDITKLSKEGKILNRREINYKSDKEYYKDRFLFPFQDNSFEYSELEGKFYVTNTNMKTSKRKDIKKFYEDSYLIGEFDFENNIVDLLPIKYPDQFLEKNFGFNNVPFFLVEEDKVFYSFSSISKVYEYNLNTKKTVEYTVNLENLPNVRNEYPDIGGNSTMQSELNSFFFNSIYGPLLSNKDYLLRTYQSAIPESEKEAPNEYMRKSFLQIYDKDFNHLKNYPLDFRFGFPGTFSSDDSMFFQLATENEDEITFLKLTIELL